MIEQHVTPDTLADRLGVHPDTVYRAIRTGQLRSVRVGRLRRIPESAVGEWLGGPSGVSVAGSVVELRREHG